MLLRSSMVKYFKIVAGWDFLIQYLEYAEQVKQAAQLTFQEYVSFFLLNKFLIVFETWLHFVALIALIL